MSLEDKLYPLLRLYEAAPQPIKSLIGRAYRAVPGALRYGRNHARFQAEARDVESWDAATIERYQIKTLRDSLIAAGKSPLYRVRFATRGLEPERFESLSQLADYPLLTKHDLIEHREALANPEVPVSKRLYLTTGGSSGVPVGFYLHKGVSRPKEQAYLDATWARCGYRAGDRVAVVRGGVTSSSANGAISYHDAIRDWLVLSASHLTAARVSEYEHALNHFQPKHLHCYPSAALMLMQLGVRLDFPLTSLLCGSEKLSSESQQQLQDYFKAPVMHWYGHSERVVLAAQRPGSTALHFWPTYGFVEFGESDASGNREIIGTSFHNHAMPLIRYRTGDYARVEESSAWPMVEALQGRDYEFLISRTGRRVSLTTINMHDHIFDGLVSLQFYQRTIGAVEFRFVTSPQWNEGRLESIQAGLLRKLGDDFELRLQRVDAVEKTALGKHKWLITEVAGV